MKYVFNRINEYFERTFESAIPQGFSSTQYILQGGVWWYASCGFSFRSSVSFGQERSPQSAPTTCTNRYGHNEKQGASAKMTVK